jgi:hypothetical protein
VEAVTPGLKVQGRRVSAVDLRQIGQWLGDHPGWSRRRLSRELAAPWNWRNGAGQLKDMDHFGILPRCTQWLVHDHWKPYFAYHQCLHALLFAPMD